MLHYVHVGNKKSPNTLLFVHGSGCNLKIFGELEKYLEDYNCILLDLKGHGESKGQCPSTVYGYIDNVANFITNSEVTKHQKNITLIGYSMGGAIVLGVALKKLPNVRKVVSLSGGARFDKLDKDFMEKIYHNQLDNNYLLECIGGIDNPLSEKYFETLEKDPDIMINDLIACKLIDLVDNLKNIDIPVKAIVAKDELLTLVEYSEIIKKEVENSELKIFETGKHFLLVVNAKGVVEEIKNFI